jgi:hypothetical protein
MVTDAMREPTKLQPRTSHANLRLELGICLVGDSSTPEVYLNCDDDIEIGDLVSF